MPKREPDSLLQDFLAMAADSLFMVTLAKILLLPDDELLEVARVFREALNNAENT